MAEEVVFPQLSGANLPSNILQAWLALHHIGVPQHNLRFLPEIGHFAAPEVVEEELVEGAGSETGEEERFVPRGPRYDLRTGRVTVDRVDPKQVRPRLTVHVRAETVMRFYEDEHGGEHHREEMVGRLAHFMEPMMAGLPGPAGEVEPPRPLEKPLARLTRQVCAQYPELMITIAANVREVLDKVAEELEKLFADPGLAGHADIPHRVAALTGQLPDLEAARADYQSMVQKLTLDDEDEEIPTPDRSRALARFSSWADVLFLADPKARPQAIERFIAELGPEEWAQQRVLIRKLQRALDYENPQEREKIVRDMIEILATEAFTASAVTDYLWGLGWIHGGISDFRRPVSPCRLDGLLLSVHGGYDHRALLLTLLQHWTEIGGFLGIGTPTAPVAGAEMVGRECLDRGVMDDGEWMELCSLAAWRRDTGDPLMLLQTAARRLIHPDVMVEMSRYMPAPSQYGTLLAQPGTTAVLGGRGKLLYPGARIFVPMAEDADEEAGKAKAKLAILLRVFLPVCLHVEVVWQEALGRLGRTAYLQHDFQQGIRLADPWTALNDTVRDEDHDRLTL